MIYTGRNLMTFARSRICVSPLPEHRRPLSACEFCRWLSMPVTFGMKGSSYLRSQITEGVKNAVSLHVDIPRTGWRGFDLPSEDSLQPYLKFPCDRFSFGSSSVRGLLLAPMSFNFSSVSTRRLYFIFLYIKSPVDLSLFTKLWIV
jgi:hypothetical protein